MAFLFRRDTKVPRRIPTSTDIKEIPQKIELYDSVCNPTQLCIRTAIPKMFVNKIFISNIAVKASLRINWHWIMEIKST